MALQVTFDTDDGEKVVRVEDLEIETLESISDQDPKSTGWFDVSTSPFVNSFRMYAVLDAMADKLGVADVERNLTPRSLDDMLKVVDDVADEAMVDGYPQTPGEQESGSSSTSQEGTDGPPMSSGDSPTANS